MWAKFLLKASISSRSWLYRNEERKNTLKCGVCFIIASLISPDSANSFFDQTFMNLIRTSVSGISNWLMCYIDYRLAALRRNKKSCRNESVTKKSGNSPSLSFNSVVRLFFCSDGILVCIIAVHILFLPNMIVKLKAFHFCCWIHCIILLVRRWSTNTGATGTIK